MPSRLAALLSSSSISVALAARAVAASAIVAVAATAGGCPDPAGTFEDFGERYDALDPSVVASSSAGPIGDCQVLEVGGDMDGTFIFALSAQLGVGKPVLFVADLVIEEGSKINVHLTPLGTPYRNPGEGESIPVMQRVGEGFNIGSYDVDPATGAFSAELPELTVSGLANPFSNRDLVATVSLTGTYCVDTAGEGKTTFCGSFVGVVTEPIDFDLDDEVKNTFAFTRFEGDIPTDPAALTYDCAGTPLKEFN